MLEPRRVTSRENASRIERDYYKRTSAFRLARRWLVIAGVAGAVAWCGWGLADRARHHAPGPVAVAHARWEHDCQACHVPLATVRSAVSLEPVGPSRLAPSEVRVAVDARCEACHRAAAHHPSQITSEVRSCGSCHADHQGRAADLKRVSDSTCTVCHGDIARHRRVVDAPNDPPVAASITRFDDEHHPAFASLAKDPGRLKFSHGRHMTEGLVFGGPSKSPPMNYSMLGEADRRRFMPAGAAETDLVQLSCGSCHEFATSLRPDDIRQVSSLLTASAPGAYALPVSYERHCAACHSLPYEPGVTDRFMRHGLDAEGMRRFLVEAAVEGAASGRAVLDAAPPPRPLPANSPSPTPAMETLRGELRAKVEASRTFTRGVCGKCHEVEDATIPVSALLDGGGKSRLETWFRVPPTGVPDVWLAKARFSHVPHRGFACRDCHAAAYPAATTSVVDGPAGPISPLDNDRVMIAGRESCTACHAPAGHDASGKMVGGVRFDCVECHGYHGLGPHHPSPPTAIGGRGSVTDALGLRR